MRCRPGDLAYVIGGVANAPPQVGTVVLIARQSEVWPDAWALEPPCIDPADGFEVHVPDHQLRPIRDPGDDAVDEVLQRIGSPNEVTA